MKDNAVLYEHCLEALRAPAGQQAGVLNVEMSPRFLTAVSGRGREEVLAVEKD